MVRLTAKDSLWKHPFWKYVVGGVGTVPIQRRDEYGSAADNKKAMAKLHEALEDGACVCLFPEGQSRYQSGLAPLKTGVGYIALETLRRALDAGKEDFTVTVIACGITYTHREKFRSDVCVVFETAARLRAGSLPELVGGPNGEKGAARAIVDSVAALLRRSVVSAPEWATVRAALAAVRLHAPVGARIALAQHARLTQSFVQVLSACTPASLAQRRLVRLASDPDIPVQDPEPSSTQEERAAALLSQLLAYQDALDAAGLPDAMLLKSATQSRLGLLCTAACRALWTAALGLIAAPGAVILSPALATGKFLEARIIRTNQGPRRIRNLDEVAQYKLAVSVFVAPTLIFGVAWGNKRLLAPGLPMPALLGASAAWLWLTMRWIEDGMASANTLAAQLRLLLSPARAAALRKQRSALLPQVQAAAEEYGLPTAEQLVANAPADCKKRTSFLSYFSLLRRRRREWGECAHYGITPVDYPEQMLLRQSQRNPASKKSE
ncbi:acyltransferase [Tribonema minus]|uniref:Acyltransferase n=1 Tax=Tribonema minus TaxID=303371 RepID=A0A836CLQ0_9STRA|nr:acyltransferase [Tribonema minus]